MNKGERFIWKPRLSIAAIGKVRFFYGILIGLLSAVTMSLFVNLSREAVRITHIHYDMSMPDDAYMTWFDRLMIAVIVALSMNFTIWFWTTNVKKTIGRKARYRMRIAGLSAWFTSWLYMFVLLRFVEHPAILLDQPERYINIPADYPWVLIALPLTIFLSGWGPLRWAVRVGRWMTISLVVCVALAPILLHITAVDRTVHNNAYLKWYEAEYSFIDKQVERAAYEYGIKYNDTTIMAMKDWYSNIAIEQVFAVLNAFEEERKVSLDTIIIEQMIIRNMKEAYYDGNIYQYATPNAVYTQMEMHDANAPEVKELILLLKELIDLVNFPVEETDYRGRNKVIFLRRAYKLYSQQYQKNYHQLEQVLPAITNSDKYAHLVHLLPELDPIIEDDDEYYPWMDEPAVAEPEPELTPIIEDR